MLVAEKQQYLESYDLNTHGYIHEAEKPENLSKPKVKQKNRIMPVVSVLIGFVLCSLTVSRYAMIAQNHSEILKLEQQLEEEYKREERLKLELNYCVDLETIEEYAKNYLEMGYPDENQVLYVEVPQQDQYEITKDVTDSQVGMVYQDGETIEETIWDKIASLID